MTTAQRLLTMAFVMLALAACGGGSGGGSGGAAGPDGGDDGGGGAADPGGGGGGGGSEPTLPADFSTSPDPDFVAVHHGLVKMTTEPAEMRIGDAGTDEALRAVCGFPLGGVGAGTIVQSATLRVTLGNIRGVPYASLGGRIDVDHIDLGDALTVVDSRPILLEPAFAILNSDRTTGERAVDVTVQVRADLAAGRTRSDFRLGFPLPSNGNFSSDEQLLPDFYGTTLEIRFAP